MNINKKITILVITIFAVIVGILFFLRERGPSTESSSVATDYGNEVFNQNETRIKTAEDARVAKLAWTVFSEYLSAAKAHDINKLKEFSRELSSTCSDPTKTKECNLLMDDVATVGATLHEEDFTHILFDDKQIILSTDFKKEDYSQLRGYAHSVIYFTRDGLGNPLVTGFGPTQGRYLAKLPNQAEAELEAALAERLIDADKDGISDFVESCLEVEKDKTCTKTDPTRRDTDGNGYWDGIEYFFSK